MYFYSNPYDDSLMVQGKPQEDITVGAFCEVFNFYDSIEDKQMSVIHYFMEDPSVNQNVSSLIPEDSRTFFVNKTEMN